MANQALAILDLDEDHCIASWQTTLLQVWSKVTRPEAIEEAMQHASQFAQRDKHMVGLMIITAQSRPIDRLTHEKLDLLTKQLLEQSVALAFVYEGNDLLGAATRSLLVKLQFGLDRPTPYKFCRSVKEALTWLQANVSEERHGSLLGRTDAVNTVRARFELRGKSAREARAAR